MAALDDFLEIRTARLVLRPLREDDAAQIYLLFGQWEVIRMLTTPPWPYRPTDADEFCRLRALRTQDGPITLALTFHGTLIGVIEAVFKSGVNPEPVYALSYWIGQPHWDKGFMSEAVRAFVTHVFLTHGGRLIVSAVLKENAASLCIQEKLGFVRGEEKLIYSRPRGVEVPLITTKLPREVFIGAAKILT
jgi:RimJ/RimL family protein N-acetyltransferase